MKLTGLRLSGTKVADLWPIKGMSLQSLNISGTLVNDLKPVLGMPLRTLYMTNCQQITDLSPLQYMTTLQNIILPPNAKNIEVLRKLPNVSRISFSSDTRKPPDQFWADYDRTHTAPAIHP